MGGGGSREETRYTYVDNTDRDREAARERERDRLAKEREQRELEEKNRIEREKKEEEERRKAQYRQEREREQAQEEARIKEETRKRLLLEDEVRRSRDELFNYKFGSKTTLDSFRGLAIDDVTKLRIGVFGPTGSGKSCFINTCERAVRQTDKGSAPDSTTGNEGTIILQDYLYEMFFHLVDTRGFFNYNANETIEFEDILEGRVKPGDNLLRQQPGMKAAKTAPAVIKDNDSEFCDKLHGAIIVVKANDSRLKEGRLRAYLEPARDILRRKGIAPMTVVTHRDELETNEDCDNAKLDASAATGSSLDHVFFMANYTKQNSARNLEIERMAFDILHYALLSAERAVKLMKQKLKNAEEDEMMRELEKHSISGQVAPDSANASVEVFLRHLQKEYQWSSNSVREVVAKLSKDDVTSVTLLASCWKDVQNYFILGMRAMVEKELKNRALIP